ncbi:MAG TPA: hypothetical protein VJK52_01960 [Candidatus Nanoarchaeia archaeon]|nr:hypothetical protein [Candidatus Nanoarchaeia archaeon]
MGKIALIGMAAHTDPERFEGLPRALTNVFGYKPDVITTETTQEQLRFFKERREALLAELSQDDAVLQTTATGVRALIQQLLCTDAEICERYADTHNIRFECIDHPIVNISASAQLAKVEQLTLRNLLFAVMHGYGQAIFQADDRFASFSNPECDRRNQYQIDEYENLFVIPTAQGDVFRDSHPEIILRELMTSGKSVIHVCGKAHLVRDLSGRRRTLISRIEDLEPTRHSMRDF